MARKMPQTGSSLLQSALQVISGISSSWEARLMGKSTTMRVSHWPFDKMNEFQKEQRGVLRDEVRTGGE